MIARFTHPGAACMTLFPRNLGGMLAMRGGGVLDTQTVAVCNLRLSLTICFTHHMGLHKGAELVSPHVSLRRDFRYFLRRED